MLIVGHRIRLGVHLDGPGLHCQGVLLLSRPGVDHQDGLLHRPTELADCLLGGLGQDPVLHRDRDRGVQVPDLFDQPPDVTWADQPTRQRHMGVGQRGGQQARGVDPVLRARPRQPQLRADVLADEVIGVDRLLTGERERRGHRLRPHPVLLPFPDLQHDQPIRLAQSFQVQRCQRGHHLQPGRR